MRIAIVTLTTTARRTGVAEYLINLIDNLQRIDPINEYYIITGKDNRYMFSLIAPNFKEVALPLTHDPGFIMRPIFYLWLTLVLPVWCMFKKIDIVHLPNTLFVPGFFPAVTTIHDVVELKTRKYSAVRTFARKLMIKSAIANSRRIITVSRSSAVDIKALGAQKIETVHLGFTNPYQSLTGEIDEDNILSRYGVKTTPYVIFIGTLLKHKNVPVLIEAFMEAARKISNLKLLLVGAPDNDFDNVRKLLNANNLKDKVSLLNFIDQTDKLVLLKRASVFCFISSYEGFGIPILEAQAAGVPVVASNISSLPEVGGNGVLLVSPDRLKVETSNAILSLMSDQLTRNSLIENGYKNLNRFSWNTLATETLRIYKEANIK